MSKREIGGYYRQISISRTINYLYADGGGGGIVWTVECYRRGRKSMAHANKKA